MKKDSLNIFDFDGTLTRRDTTLPMALFFSKKQKYYKFLIFLFFYFTFRMKFYSNEDLKKKFVKLFFKGRNKNRVCDELVYFLKTKILINEVVYSRFTNCLNNEQDKVLIVSANFDIVIESWLKLIGQEKVGILATKLETINDTLSGEIIGDICRGKMKAARLQATLNIDNYKITSYADESSDKYIMELANKIIWVQDGLFNETNIQDQS